MILDPAHGILPAGLSVSDLTSNGLAAFIQIDCDLQW